MSRSVAYGGLVGGGIGLVSGPVPTFVLTMLLMYPFPTARWPLVWLGLCGVYVVWFAGLGAFVGYIRRPALRSDALKDGGPAVTSPPPRRPWWKRKRTWAALALFWAATYELGYGPAVYCVRRGWLPRGFVFDLLYPFPRMPHAWGEVIGLWEYDRWWADAANRQDYLHELPPPSP